jgi:hypothetical protein
MVEFVTGWAETPVCITSVCHSGEAIRLSDQTFGPKNTMASVRKRTIPTERPPLVSEVSANFLRTKGATWSA